MQIEVILPGSTPVINVRTQVKIRGIDQIEPAIPINALMLGAFAQAVDRIEIVGSAHAGAFTRVDDAIRLEVVNGRPVSTRKIIYEFSGWQER